MALELHLWKPAHFGGNRRRGKDVDVGLSIDAWLCKGSLQGRGGGEKRRATHKQKVRADVNLR